MTLRLIIIGLGKRVTECALPAIAAAGDMVRIEKVYARSTRTQVVNDEPISVHAIDELTPEDLASGPTVYLCVPKTAISAVLQHLDKLNPEGADLLIDTPVLRLRDFKAASLLRRWRKVSVAEDCARMPWIELLVAAQDGPLGPLKEVVFEQAAYAYHGIASARALAGGSELARARRRKSAQSQSRLLEFANGLDCEIIDPRDYAQGRVLARFTNGLASDQPRKVEGAKRIELNLDATGQITALQLGPTTVALNPAESSLTGGDPPETSIIGRQAAMKRVGFLRLLRELARGQPGYLLDDGLEDMVADHLLERLGRYQASFFTSPRHKLARMLYSLASSLSRS